MIGRTVGPYRIEEEIGRGGMSVVYRAVDERLGRTVALKFLSRDLMLDPTAKERFLVEARSVSAIDHPNVCTVHEIGETEDGESYIVLAYYAGETLADRVARGPLPIDEALDLGLQVARGLARAHESGILHRDVKPANVVVTERGEAKVLDFGLAKLTEGTRVTMPGLTLGTPAYMSPEAVRGEEVDERTDLWSLGCLLHELLTGELPFKGGNHQATIYSILEVEPTSPAVERAETPAPLADLVGRLLQKERTARPASADEVVRELEALRSGEGTPYPRPSARAASGGRHALVVPGALALVAVLYALWPRGDDPAPPSAPVAGSATTVAVLPFTVRGGAEYAYLGDGLVDLLGTKLDGAGSLRSVDPHALLSHVEREAPDAAGDVQAARGVAERFGAELYLLGELLEAGGSLHLSASLYALDEEQPVGRASVEGEVAAVFDLVDQLVVDLLSERFSAAAGNVLSSAVTTTTSLPALKAFLHGEEDMRSGRFTGGLEAFEEAVELDPEFALAWYRLSVAAEWATRLGRTEEAAQKAYELADRLSDHDRALLEARLANRRGDAVEAERLYRAILAQHPDDVEAWTQLGEVLFHYAPMVGRPLADAREPYERTLTYQPDLVESMWHLARIASTEGKLDEVDQLVGRINALNPEGERALEMDALRAFALGDRDAQEEVLGRLAEAQENVVALAFWNVSCYTDDVEGARRVIAVNTRPERASDARASAHGALAYVDAARGRWADAWDQLDRAAELRPNWALEHRANLAVLFHAPVEEQELREIRAALVAFDPAAEPPSALPTTFFAANDDVHAAIRLHLLGLVEAILDEPSALDRAEELTTLELENPSVTPYILSDSAAEIRARVAWEQGDFAEALRILDTTRRQALYQTSISSVFTAQTYGRLAHGLALEAAERHEEGLLLLSSFRTISGYELAYEPPATLARARIHERLGDTSAARAEYERFLELWGDADASLRPLADEARGRLDDLGR
jgi:serine/threonine-protein kinase